MEDAKKIPYFETSTCCNSPSTTRSDSLISSLEQHVEIWPPWSLLKTSTLTEVNRKRLLANNVMKTACLSLTLLLKLSLHREETCAMCRYVSMQPGGCALAKEGYLRLKNVEHTEKYAQQRTTDDVSLFAGNQHRPATAKAEVTPHPGHSCSPAKQVLTDAWITWNIWISFCDAWNTMSREIYMDSKWSVQLDGLNLLALYLRNCPRIPRTINKSCMYTIVHTILRYSIRRTCPKQNAGIKPEILNDTLQQSTNHMENMAEE